MIELLKKARPYLVNFEQIAYNEGNIDTYHRVEKLIAEIDAEIARIESQQHIPDCADCSQNPICTEIAPICALPTHERFISNPSDKTGAIMTNPTEYTPDKEYQLKTDEL